MLVRLVMILWMSFKSEKLWCWLLKLLVVDCRKELMMDSVCCRFDSIRLMFFLLMCRCLLRLLCLMLLVWFKFCRCVRLFCRV